jgi:CheY-like chemotaxis protein
MKILVVDDDPIIRRLLPAFCMTISKQFVPFTAQNGEQALQVLAFEPVDLILTDVEMPVMNGCELVARVKKQYPTIKIIAMTGCKCDEVDKRLRDVGISKYIEKPFTVRDLAMSIESVFENGYSTPIPRGLSCFFVGTQDVKSSTTGGLSARVAEPIESQTENGTQEVIVDAKQI